ncbi:dimethylarginine dimethylaminohydrolase family protein [Pseudahrensia aquimaris]|uniref:Dimethylarginine dimethylaminohydrolase family protein n=1 Tax=Pseudahrensia aquimaris TaxID=744461 RepID=A0ABW3FDI9_9HYPH
MPTIDPTRFTDAILRRPARSAVNGLRAVDIGAPDIDAMMGEHLAYEAALGELGVQTHVLPALEDFPDSVYVEDPALVFAEGAILLRPGAPSRFGETAEIAPVLRERFDTVIALDKGFSDGGDILLTADKVIIGLSARTDEEGALALAGALSKLGYDSATVSPPEGVLHFKTACSLVAPDTVLATRQLIEGGDYFGGLRVLQVPDGEEPAANALCVNGTVLLAQGFQNTAKMLRDEGFAVRELPLNETMKLDAGLSCMSLRWNRVA